MAHSVAAWKGKEEAQRQRRKGKGAKAAPWEGARKRKGEANFVEQAFRWAKRESSFNGTRLARPAIDSTVTFASETVLSEEIAKWLRKERDRIHKESSKKRMQAWMNVIEFTKNPARIECKHG